MGTTSVDVARLQQIQERRATLEKAPTSSLSPSEVAYLRDVAWLLDQVRALTSELSYSGQVIGEVELAGRKQREELEAQVRAQAQEIEQLHEELDLGRCRAHPDATQLWVCNDCGDELYDELRVERDDMAAQVAALTAQLVDKNTEIARLVAEATSP